jgi:predicted metal-dependent hydrolase
MNARRLFCQTGRTCQTRPTNEEKDAFKAEVREWADRLKARPAQIRVQKMRSKWASCSPGKWISFSEDLLGDSRSFQQYAIVHELLHLRIPNHGKLFKSLMCLYLPDWERCMVAHPLRTKKTDRPKRNGS